MAKLYLVALCLSYVHWALADVNVTADAWIANRVDAPEINVAGPVANATGDFDSSSTTVWRSVYGKRTFSAGDGVVTWWVKVGVESTTTANAWVYAVGVASNDVQAGATFWLNPGTGIAYIQRSGNAQMGFSTTANLAPYADGDIIQIKLDLDMATIEFLRNGVSSGIAHSGFSTAGSWRVAAAFSSHLSSATLLDADGNLAATPDPSVTTQGTDTSGSDSSNDSDGSDGSGGGGGGGGGSGKSISSAAAEVEGADGLSDGEMAGIVIAAVVLAACVAGAVLFSRRKDQRLAASKLNRAAEEQAAADVEANDLPPSPLASRDPANPPTPRTTANGA